MFEEMNTQTSALPQWVQVWMNWMSLVLLSSVFFVKNHKEARWVLAATLFTFPVALVIFHFKPSIHLFGIAHLLLWLPLCTYLLRRWKCSGEAKYQTLNPFRVWITLALLTMAISLIFDVRDLYLIAVGLK